MDGKLKYKALDVYLNWFKIKRTNEIYKSSQPYTSAGFKI